MKKNIVILLGSIAIALFALLLIGTVKQSGTLHEVSRCNLFTWDTCK